MLSSYLDGFPGEQGAGGSALEAPGLVELDEAFVVLQSHSGRHAGTAGAPVHLLGGGATPVTHSSLKTQPSRF